MRDSSIFYRSFYEAINELPDANQLEVYRAIFEYSFNFNEIELNGLSKTIFTLIKPNLEANNKRYLSGIVPKEKRNGSETEAKPKRNKSKDQANKDKDKDVDKDNNEDKDKDKNENEIIFEQFWKLYDYKKGKDNALKAWKKLSKSEIDLILLHVPKYVESTPDVQYRKHPTTYLNQKSWEDEIIEKKLTFNQNEEHLKYWYESSLRQIASELRTPKEHNAVVRQNNYDSKFLLPE